MTNRALIYDECIWDDCDQTPLYCEGHALEFANVSDENEAIRLRHQIGALKGFLLQVAQTTTDRGLAEGIERLLREQKLLPDVAI